MLTEFPVMDSDSDVDDLIHTLKTSASSFSFALNMFQKALNNPKQEPSQYVSDLDFGNLVSRFVHLIRLEFRLHALTLSGGKFCLTPGL